MNMEVMKEGLKEEGADGYSKMKRRDLQSFYVETKIEIELKKIRMEEGKKNEKERLKLLTPFSLLKRSVREFRYKEPVYKKEIKDT